MHRAMHPTGRRWEEYTSDGQRHPGLEMCKLDRETDEGAANHEEAREWCPWEGETVSKKGGGRNAEKNWGPGTPPSSGATAPAQR